MKVFHKNMLKKECWVDICKFVSKSKHEPASGLFEIFGNYSDEPPPPNTVCDNLLGWIYDNFHKIEAWFSIVLKQKGLSLSDWAESTYGPKCPGDEPCLNLLCRMYHKHALVHLKHHWWSTIQHPLPGDLDEILSKCHMEFVFGREWVFGEVKVIWKPISAYAASPKPLGIMDSAMTTDNNKAELTSSMSHATSKRPVTENVITENVLAKQQSLIKSCVISIEPLKVSNSVILDTWSNNGNGYNMCNIPPKPQLAHQTSECNRAVIDYSKFMTGEEDDSSPPRK